MTEKTPAPVHGEAPHPSRHRIVAMWALFLVLLVSVVPWRPQAFYEGGLDPVVVAKAVLSMVAFGGAALLVMRSRVRMPIGIGPAFTVVIALLVSLLGSMLAGNAAATVVLLIRVLIVVATVVLLLSCAPWGIALGALLSAMGSLGVVAAVTGVPVLLATGRLGGGVPELHPNELAALAAAPMVGLVSFALRSRLRMWHLAVIVVLLAIVVATGSRSALLGVALATVVAVLTNGVRDRFVLYGILVAIPIGYSIAAFTGIVGEIASRNGSSETATSLDSRLTAWNVVLGWGWRTWERWLGLGLSVKEVPVDNKWRPEQVLDSSWVSMLAQVGVIGAVLVGLLVLWCLVAVIVSGSRRGVILPLLLLLLVRSITESGLLDASSSFILLLTLATLATHRSRHARDRISSLNGPLALAHR